MEEVNEKSMSSSTPKNAPSILNTRQRRLRTPQTLVDSMEKEPTITKTAMEEIITAVIKAMKSFDTTIPETVQASDMYTSEQRNQVLEKIKAIGKMAKHFQTLPCSCTSQEDKDPAFHKEIMARLDGIDRKLATKTMIPVTAKHVNMGTTSPMSYAQMAAMPLRQKDTACRATIPIRVDDNRKESREELLTMVKEQIPEAQGFRPTRNPAKLAVIVKSAVSRDQILSKGVPKDCGFSIMRREYQVMVLNVPLNTPVTVKDSKGNQKWLESMAKNNKGVTPQKVSWLYTEDQLNRLRSDPRRRNGSMILTVATEQQQHHIVREGLFIGPMWYEADLWDMSLTTCRCFKCQRWGHVQSACTDKDSTCGHCAGKHPTRECKSTTEEQTCCPNCKGRDHKAWMAKKCRSYAEYWSRIQGSRNILLHKSREIQASRSPHSNMGLDQQKQSDGARENSLGEAPRDRKRATQQPAEMMAQRHPSRLKKIESHRAEKPYNGKRTLRTPKPKRDDSDSLDDTLMSEIEVETKQRTEDSDYNPTSRQ